MADAPEPRERGAVRKGAGFAFGATFGCLFGALVLFVVLLLLLYACSASAD